MKTKRIISVVLALAMCIGMVFIVNAETEIPEGYTPIYTAEDLNNIRNDLDGKYILMNDIDLSAYDNWIPIGSSDAPFKGELNGNGKSVLNLTVKDYQVSENKIYVGMFSSMSSCSVTDLNLINVDIDIQNKSADSASLRVGALAGYASDSVVENCAVTGNINVENFSTGFIGGILGSENLILSHTNCANYANISVSSDCFNNIGIGGITGNAVSVEKCCNYGNISVSSTDNDDADSDVYIGGICGKPHQFGNMIKNCYNRGSIALDFSAPSTYVGGIIGQCLILENCYNSGDINYTDNFKGSVGAIAGELLEGLSAGRGPHIDNAYYNNADLSYVSEPDEFYDINNVRLLTEEEFKNQDSFVGFNFDMVWELEENGYPVLKNQPKVTVKESIKLEVDETYPIKEGKDYTVTSDSPLCIDYITKPENGEIIALHPGQLTLTVIYDYGYTAEYEITITEPVCDDPIIPEPDPEPINNVDSAEIVHVPLKNRIVFSAGSPNLPDGIVLKLKYKDGSEKTETVIYNAAEGCYRAGEERVIGSVRATVVEYGVLTDTLYINDSTVSVEYDYFVPPTLSYIFMEIVNFVLRIVL